MTATEWAEKAVLPAVCSFALGVLVTDIARDWQMHERLEALVVRRVEAAFDGCMPKEQIGAKAILAWREDGRLHCTRFEDLGYRRASRSAGVVPVLSLPVAEAVRKALSESIATPEEARP